MSSAANDKELVLMVSDSESGVVEMKVKKHFNKFIENPSILVKKNSIKHVLDGNQELDEIKKKFKLDSILTKVRTEKKKFSEKRKIWNN